MTMIFRNLLFLAFLTTQSLAYDCTGDANESSEYVAACKKQVCSHYNEICPNANCINTGESPFFRCDCSEGFENLTDQNCVAIKESTKDFIPDACQQNPCSDSATSCKTDSDTKEAVCVCEDGSEVSATEECPVTEPTVITSCDPSPCAEDAKCVEETGGVMCMCFDKDDNVFYRVGYGANCGVENSMASANKMGSCSDDSCGLHARCFNSNPGFECRCANGHDVAPGHDCLDTYKIMPCDSPNSCADNASCKMLYGEEVCTCNDGYEGDGVTCSTKIYNLRKRA